MKATLNSTSSALFSLAQMVVRVGIVGFGSLGQYLYAHLSTRPDLFELVFVWNRTAAVFEAHPSLASLVLTNLADFAAR